MGDASEQAGAVGDDALEAAGEGTVQLGGPSPKKSKMSREGEGPPAQKWQVSALAAASKAPTFGKTTFAAAAIDTGAKAGDVPAWLSKKAADSASSSAGGAGAKPVGSSFFTSATNKAGTTSWLSGPSSATSTLSTVSSGLGATTKPPAWLKPSALGSASASSSLSASKAATATTAPPAWLASSSGSGGTSSSSTSAASSSLTSSTGLFTAASKGGGASWLKPSGSTTAVSTESLGERPVGEDTAAAAAALDKDISGGDSPSEEIAKSSSPTKRRKYEEVGVRTGEESESCLQKVERVRLYHFRDGNWSERARECTLHLNETKGNGDGSSYRARIVIRTKETKSLVFNASLWPSMECQKHGASEKVTRICCYNVAETDGTGAVLGTYLISPSDKTDGSRLRAGIEKAKAKCPAPKAGDAPAGAGNSSGGAGYGVSSDADTQDNVSTAQVSSDAESNAKESEAPAKKPKTSAAASTEEPAANPAPVATSTPPDGAEAASTAGVPATGAQPPKVVAQPPPAQQTQQQEEEEEDPDADL